MSNNTGKLILLAGGIATVAGVVYVTNLKNAADKISVKVTKLYAPKLSMKGLSFKLDLQLDNPTSTELTIKRPVVRIFSGTGTNRVELVSSPPSTDKTVIRGNNRTVIPGFPLEMGLAGTLKFLAQNLTDFISLISNKANGEKRLGKTISIDTYITANGIEVVQTDVFNI